MFKTDTTISGFTLIELLVTIAIATILLMVAAPSFLTFQRNSELTSAANSFVASLNAARGEAMKRGMYAMVIPTDGLSWNGGWTVFVDANRNGILDVSTDPIIFSQPAPPIFFTVSGSGSAAESPAYVMFDASGYAKTKAAGFGSLSISIERNDLGGAAKTEQTRHIIVAKTGRVRVCKPSALDATCSAGLSE